MMHDIESSGTPYCWWRSAAAIPVAMLLFGCSPQGAGTVEVSDPQAIRAKMEGGAAPAKPTTEKEKKAIELEEAAKKSHPKLS
jgi:hypothetical protein